MLRNVYMLLPDWSGLKLCSDRIWIRFDSCCLQGISLKDQLITSRLDEWMVPQRMISRGAQIMLTI